MMYMFAYWWLNRIRLQCRSCRFHLWVRKIPWRKKWQPAPVFLSGKSHGQRSLVGYSPWGRKRVGHDLVTKQQEEGYMSKFHPRLPVRFRMTIIYCLVLVHSFPHLLQLVRIT